MLLARKAHKGHAFVHAALCLLENSSCFQLLSVPFQDSGSISWFPSLGFHSTLYLPSSQLLPHYTEIIYLCVCLPSYSTILRGQRTCLTHLPTPRQNVAQQSTNPELNCKPVRLASSLLGRHPAHSQPKLCSQQHLDDLTNDQAQVSQCQLGFQSQALPTHLLCALGQDTCISESSSTKQGRYSTI